MSDYTEHLAHPIDDNPLWDQLEKNYDKYFYSYSPIPKKIHQIWLGSPLPAKYDNDLSQRWRNIHPDWEYKLWTDADIDSFGMINKKLFDAMDNMGAKSDILRYEIIYRYGGLYIDTDFIPIVSFKDFLHLDFFSGGGPAKHPHTFNGLFGAKPGHPILEKIINTLASKTPRSEKDYTEIMKVTGPDFFSEIVMDHISKNKNDRIVIFPENFFYPFPMELRFDKDIKDCTDLSKPLSFVKDMTYAVHLWHTAWQEPQPQSIKETPKNNKWHLSVPKILHVYWGGERMPFIRYMTIKSFMDQNPDWQVMFWYPKHLFVKLTWDTFELKYDVTCDDYLPELMKLPIKKGAIDFVDFGYKNNIPESYKSDFIRDNMLYIFGGAWADSDVLFFKPMTALEVNKPENKGRETFVCIGSYGHSNGFLMGTKNNAFFGRMSSLIINEYNPADYQSTGPSFYNKHYPTIESINKISSVVNMKMDVVYAHNAGSIAELLNGTSPRFTSGSIGCHWYAGHPLWGKFMKDTNGGKINLPNNIIGNLLKNAINFKK
jgi:mannosyltransferase OCH1-like enzyme